MDSTALRSGRFGPFRAFLRPSCKLKVCDLLVTCCCAAWLPGAFKPAGHPSKDAVSRRVARFRKQVDDAGGIADDLYALTGDAQQLSGHPSFSGWFDGTRNGAQLQVFTDAVVGAAS